MRIKFGDIFERTQLWDCHILDTKRMLDEFEFKS